MFIKISQQANTFNERIIEIGSAQLHLDIQIEKTEYFVETEQFIFLIDTNISKNRTTELHQQLNLLSIDTIHQVPSILHENYFLILIDKTTLNIHLMRDVCGVKTAYFSINNKEEIVIGSVMHEVAKTRDSISFDSVGVEQLIYSGYLLDGQTLYKGVKELKAGTQLILNANFETVESTRIQLNLAARDNDLSAVANMQQLRQEFKTAHANFISPKNKVLLSGGLDSIAMAIALDDLETQNLSSISFKVKDTTQDETVYATDIAEHLNLENLIVEIDSENTQNVADFKEKILKMNNPYFGAWIFGNFKGDEQTMFYAGQDSRLHTPALNEVDKWAFALLPYQEKFWLKNILTPIAAFVQGIFKGLSWDKSSSSILKNLYKATHIFKLEAYINKFHLKLGEAQLKAQGLPTKHYDKYKAHFDFDLKKIPSPRALYNKLVELKWGEQYIYDMRYLQDLARINGTYIAMPFYNKRLAEFSSGIPFKLATKALMGRARFGKKRSIVYKYVLRHALKDKLTDTCFYRAKAVSQTLHQLFNGAVGSKIKALITNDLLQVNSFVKTYQLEDFVQDFLKSEQFDFADATYLSKIYYIGTLVVYQQEIVSNQAIKNQVVAIIVE